MQTKVGAVALLGLGFFAGGAAIAAQGTQAPSAAPEQRGPQSEIRRAIRWKAFAYTCEGGVKVSVYVSDSLARVLFQNREYLLRQAPSTDGNRYSDGKLLWWSKGEGGFLQEDTPDGNGKMLAKDCQLDKSAEAKIGVLTGTVSYRERVALPPEAVIELQLREMPIADAREVAKVVAEDRITLGNRQVPVPFELKFDVAKISANRAYGLTAWILVGGRVRFYSGHGYLVLTQENPSRVDLVLDQAGTDVKGKQ